ncbi:MAG: hypothetical protein GX963_13410 [Bacteroidales bacterium]|nr:hypothetical protein [Bacteroidales bacterium]
MKIEIHSIETIETRAQLPFTPKTILISMGDTDAEPPRLNNRPDHILRIVFDDVTLEEIKMEHELPESVTSSDDELIEYLHTYGTHVFSDIQARKIAQFVLRHISSTDVLICQCHFGQSRSAGCAAAIAEYFNGNGIDIFADYKYYPNKLVFHKVLKALKDCGNEQQ